MKLLLALAMILGSVTVNAETAKPDEEVGQLNQYLCFFVEGSDLHIAYEKYIRASSRARALELILAQTTTYTQKLYDGEHYNFGPQTRKEGPAAGKDTMVKCYRAPSTKTEKKALTEKVRTDLGNGPF